MWALPDEPSDYIVGVYLNAATHADETIRRLDLDSPGRVSHWAQAPTSLEAMLVLMVGETAQHAGHADILRELIVAADTGSKQSDAGRLSQVQEAADQFR